MIDAKELRIGNWVSYWNETQWETVLVAGMLTNTRIHVMHQEKQLGVHPGELQAIPLTPESLEKAGGKRNPYLKVDIAVRLNCGPVVVEWRHEKAKILWFNSEEEELEGIEVKSLHQLQNIYFALAGQELEIIL